MAAPFRVTRVIRGSIGVSCASLRALRPLRGSFVDKQTQSARSGERNGCDNGWRVSDHHGGFGGEEGALPVAPSGRMGGGWGKGGGPGAGGLPPRRGGSGGGVR